MALILYMYFSLKFFLNKTTFILDVLQVWMPRSFLKNFQKKASKFDDSVSGRGVIDLFTIENLAGIKDDSVVSGTPEPNQIYHMLTSFFFFPWTDSYNGVLKATFPLGWAIFFFSKPGLKYFVIKIIFKIVIIF